MARLLGPFQAVEATNSSDVTANARSPLPIEPSGKDVQDDALQEELAKERAQSILADMWSGIFLIVGKLCNFVLGRPLLCHAQVQRSCKNGMLRSRCAICRCVGVPTVPVGTSGFRINRLCEG